MSQSIYWFLDSESVHLLAFEISSDFPNKKYKPTWHKWRFVVLKNVLYKISFWVSKFVNKTRNRPCIVCLIFSYIFCWRRRSRLLVSHMFGYAISYNSCLVSHMLTLNVDAVYILRYFSYNPQNIVYFGLYTSIYHLSSCFNLVLNSSWK